MIAQHASMVGSCLITIAPSWVLRKKDEPMTTALREAKSTLPQDEWRTIGLFDHMIKVITDNNDMDHTLLVQMGETHTQVSVDMTKDFTSGKWSQEHLRQQCVRGTIYTADAFTNAGKNAFACNDDDMCTKKVLSNRIFTHGLFQICCGTKNCPCGNSVLCWQFMDDGESPRNLFELLEQRFITIPKYIIYDNGCKAKAYALARNPSRFGSSLFLIDLLHEPNHVKSCHCSHWLKLYRDHPVLSTINSQICEQLNAVMKRNAAKVVRFMNLSHATIYVCVFCLLFNVAKFIKI